ncbi:hypothetical protein [Kitasatospora griseola]|uniref:hypothetical protein n=1 Tax=Kitasatospora griseola TaxID=2064 RepID=UPI0016702EF2|nr:hypothetical protein [Kitasatospora griseola]
MHEQTGVTESDPDRDPDEHVRYACYRRAFADVAPEGGAGLVARVLTDPDGAMAGSAVRGYLDRRAVELFTDPGYPAWRAEMAEVVAANDFISRRLREWTLLRAAAVGEPWEVDELLTATNWCRLRAAETSTAGAVLAALVEGGRAKRIRNAAKLMTGKVK